MNEAAMSEWPERADELSFARALADLDEASPFLSCSTTYVPAAVDKWNQALEKVLEEEYDRRLFALREEQQGAVRRTGDGGRSHWRLNGVYLTLEGDAVERTTLMAQHLPDRGGGKVKLDGLPPGDYHFVSVPSGIVFTPASVRVPRDEEVVVTWREAEE